MEETFVHSNYLCSDFWVPTHNLELKYKDQLEFETAFALKNLYPEKFARGPEYFLSSVRNSLFYALIGVMFLVSSLALAFFSATLLPFAFGPPILRYNIYLILLAFVFTAVGGFFLFRAGQAKPPSSVLRKTLVEQVKSVKENQ